MNWTGWTDELEAEASRLYREGISASEIAKAIGAPSRDAVIGKLYRQGVTRSPAAAARAQAAHAAAISAARQARFGTKAPKPQAPSAPRALKAPPVKAPVVHNPLGTKHRQSGPNQAPCVFGAGVKLKPVAVASNGTRTYPQPEPKALPRQSASVQALAEASRKLMLLELNSHACKFGTHEEGGEHLFCGHETKPGSVYCASHHAICLTPPAPPKKRERPLRRAA